MESSTQANPLINPADTLNLPRVYPSINLDRPREYWDSDLLKVKWSSIDSYNVIHKIGRGKYSEVYEGVNRGNGEKVCLKILKPVRHQKILREIKILQNLHGGPNIIKLFDVARDEASQTPCLVFEYVNNTHYRHLFEEFQDMDVRNYLYNLLQALDYCHSQGIMHRDVKPHNILFDSSTKTFRLIDWGLADFYHPNHSYNVRVASRYYKSPELLVDDYKYHYSLDIWSAGCTMAEMIFKVDGLFQGEDNYDQLIQIARVMGTDELLEYMRKYNLQLNKYYQQRLDRFPVKQLKSFINSTNSHLVDENALDLLQKMLIYDKNLRITAGEALKHAYFKPIRDQQQQKTA